MDIIRNAEDMEKSFFRYLIPAMISTLLGGLYTIVDGFFVGRVMGDNGLASINLAYPVSMLIFAVGSMIGLGGSVIMSTYLGKGDIENYNKSKQKIIINLILVGIILTIVLFLLKDKMIGLLKVKQELFEYVNNYVTVIVLGSIFQVMSIGSLAIVRNLGKTMHAMIFMSSGLISNIILDYLFLIVFDLKTSGAALATIIAEGLAAVLSIYYIYLKKENRSKFSLMFDLKFFVRSILIGLSPFGLMMSPVFVVIINNMQCLKYGGEIAVSAYSVINYIIGSVMLFFEGISEGCQPMVSFFNGMGKYDLQRGVFKKGLLIAITLSILFVICILILKTHIGEIFGASMDANIIISFAMPIAAFSFIMQSVVRFGTSYFYSSGESRCSSFLTYIEPLIISPLCIIILTNFFGLNGVWFAIPLVQFILLVLFLILFYSTNIRKYKIELKSI